MPTPERRQATFSNGVPGVYISARYNPVERIWTALYIGETESFRYRLNNCHERLGCARRNGKTHIHVRQNHDGREARQRGETDLILRWKPPCNRQ